MKALLEQFKALWARLEAPQRVTIVLVALGFITAITVLSYGATRSTRRVLMSNASVAQITNAVSYLKENKVDYEVRDNQTTLLVPDSEWYSLRKDLAEQDLLGDNTTVGFELLDESGFADSSFREQKNYDRAVAGTIERSINTIEGVKKSRVIVVRPTPSPFLDDDEHQASASIWLEMKKGRRATESQVRAIVNLAQGSVLGLKPENVSVADAKGPLTRSEEDSSALHASTTMEAERDKEAYLTRRAQSVLERMLGPGRSVVTVDVDMDFTIMTESSTDPTTKMEKSESTQTTDRSTPVAGTGGQAGTASNVEGAQAAAAGGAESATETQEIADREYVVGETRKATQHEVGRLEGMTVSVLLDWKDEVTETENPETGEKTKTIKRVPFSAEEKTQFEELVLSAIGYESAKNLQESRVAGSAKNFQVKVESIDMYRAPEEQPVDTLVAGVGNEALMDYIRYGAVLVVALGLLFVARGQLKRSHTVWETERAKQEAEEKRQKQKEGAVEESNEALMERRMERKEAIRKQILDDPKTAAQVLKMWLYE